MTLQRQTDGGLHSQWRLVAAGVALIGTCYGFARFAYGLFSPQFQREFTLTSSWSGVIGAGSYVGYCVAIVASSLLTQRWGPRRVAVLAGAVASTGMAVVAVAPSGPVLAVGLLIAGSSTGIASPPLAAAVARWVLRPRQDRAQTLVNAGTGLGVLASGPVAFALTDHWRWAWAVFALTAAAVTWWIHAAIPCSARTDRAGAESARPVGRPVGAMSLMLGSLVMGLSSIAVWTFGRELIMADGNASALLGSVMWALIGAAGIAGAMSGPLIHRIGIRASWAALMVALGAATTGIAIAPAATWIVTTSAAVFGATYISLTGVALVWATRLYVERPATGVGASFFMIAAGQAVGAPLAGFGADHVGLPAVFYACAGIALAGAAIPLTWHSPHGRRPGDGSTTDTTETLQEGTSARLSVRHGVTAHAAERSLRDRLAVPPE